MLSWIRKLLRSSSQLPSGVVSIGEALSNPDIHSDPSTQAAFTQPEELDHFFDSYAFIQRPDWVGPMLDFLSKQDGIPMVAIAGLTGFLAEVINQNPGLDSEWNSKLTYACPALRNLYAKARELTPEAILQMEPSTENNDLFWSAFRASGNLQYVGKVIDAMRLIEFGSDRGQLETGVSAKWSLAAHLQSFPQVHFYAMTTASEREETVQKHLNDVLTKDVEAIKAESRQLLRR